MKTKNNFYGISSRGFREALLYAVNSIIIPVSEVGTSVYSELVHDKIFEFYQTYNPHA